MSIKYMSTILDVDAFTCTQKIILLCIADYANDEGVAWPGKSAIAKKCRVSPTTVKNQLKKLSEMGVISIRRRKTEESKIHDTNVYWINLKAIVNLESTSGNDDPRANSALGHLTPEDGATVAPKPSIDPSNNNRSPLNPPKGESEFSGKQKKSSRKTPMPDVFQITESMQDWYTKQDGFVLSVQAATEQWVDAMKARGATYADWVSAWRNGMRLQNKWASEREGPKRKPTNLTQVDEYSEQTNPDDYAPPQWFQDRESGGEQ